VVRLVNVKSIPVGTVAIENVNSFGKKELNCFGICQRIHFRFLIDDVHVINTHAICGSLLGYEWLHSGITRFRSSSVYQSYSSVINISFDAYR